MCASCLLVSVLKVMGPFTVKVVVCSVAGHMSDETANDTIKVMFVRPEFMTDHRAAKALCPVPEKPKGIDFMSIMCTKVAGETTVTGCIPEEVPGKVTCLSEDGY